MRDVQQKILSELGMDIESDMFELLVHNQIINLDLPVVDVFEQVWKKSLVDGGIDLDEYSEDDLDGVEDLTSMVVVYRIKGLNGEATEEEINTLSGGNAKKTDPEEEFKITNVMLDCEGLETLTEYFETLQVEVRFKNKKGDLDAQIRKKILAILSFCCNVKANRERMLQIKGLGVLMKSLNQALWNPAKTDAAVAHLNLIKRILQVDRANRVDEETKPTSERTLPSNGKEESPGVSPSSMDIDEPADTEEYAERPEHALVDEKTLTVFLESLRKPHIQKCNPELMMEIVPALTFGNYELVQTVLNFFLPVLDWEAYDDIDPKSKKENSEEEFLVKCFCWLAEKLPPVREKTGSVIRQIAAEEPVLCGALNYVQEHFSHLPSLAKKIKVAMVNRPALPIVLKVLTGFVKGHRASQDLAYNLDVIPALHAMEGISTKNRVGPEAESLLEALTLNNPEIKTFVDGLRSKTRLGKKKRARKLREQMLEKMKARKTKKGDDAGSASRKIMSKWGDMLKKIETDNSKLRCIMCQEGYKFKKDEQLGIYVYNKDVTLIPVDQTGSEADYDEEPIGCSTVTHFNLIHFSCHRAAMRADARAKKPKKEWEGATLRNSQTKCNNIFPIQSKVCQRTAFHLPGNVQVQYRTRVKEYWSRIRRESFLVSGFTVSNFEVHRDDFRLLLLRFGYEESFSEYTRGGGRASNMKFIPYMLQLMIHLHNDLNEDTKKGLLENYRKLLAEPDPKFSPPKPEAKQVQGSACWSEPNAPDSPKPRIVLLRNEGPSGPLAHDSCCATSLMANPGEDLLLSCILYMSTNLWKKNRVSILKKLMHHQPKVNKDEQNYDTKELKEQEEKEEMDEKKPGDEGKRDSRSSPAAVDSPSLVPTLITPSEAINTLATMGEYRPQLLLFGLVDRLQVILKQPRKPTPTMGPLVVSSSPSRSLSDSEVDVLDLLRENVRYHDETILDELEDVLNWFNKKLVPCKSAAEYFSVLEIDPKAFS